jgi:myosin heavy subunit
MTINDNKLNDLVMSQKSLMLETLKTCATQDIMNIMMSHLSESSDTLNGSLSEGVKEIAKAGTEAIKSATDILGLASAIDEAWASANQAGAPVTHRNIEKAKKAKEEWNKLALEIYNADFGSSSKKRSGGGSGGSSKDPWVEAFEREKKDLKHKLEMNEISEKEYYDRLKELNEKYFGEISGKHQKYLDKYRENEEEAYKGLSKLYEQVKQDLEKQIEDGYEDAINALKDEEKKAVKEVEQSIKALKAEKDKVLDGIQDQIDALKDEKDSVEEYWNNQINLIKQENNVLQQQNELLQKQQELQQAKQKKVMVVKDGRFQLTEDESEVAKAEQNLSDYQDQLSYEQQIQEMEDLRDAQVKTLEDRIKSLEEYKDYMQDYYDNQIEQMESYKDKLEEQYEAQIEALQKQLDVFKEGAKQLENIENGKLQAQVIATDEEAMNYETRLKNLKNYINEYNRLLTQLGIKGAQVDTAYSPIKGLHTPISIATSASGTASVDKDGLMLVGESPNTELLIGSNLNNSVNSGQFVKLRRGDGVVNAESTSTLAGMLNMMQTPQQNSISKTTTQHFAFGNITLPNVKDGDSFVRTLSQKFNNYSIQVSNNRA